MSVEFKGWGKTQRFNGLHITVTEKIDGTNACVIVQNGEVAGCQSRNRLIDIHNDNMGFANWVEVNKEGLSKLGEGYHYGEWAGPGIQKNPHNFTEKQFLLFNASRPMEFMPDCVGMVPVLYEGEYKGQEHIDGIMEKLKVDACMNDYTPEGICIYWHEHRSILKYTFQGNKSKWSL